ncbi:MAG TPA: riboflavin synthase [Gaiellales bacterium]|nr:riboflavin synthase [Gaiellales bacterium]
MFTGIVIESGTIRAARPADGGVDLAVDAPVVAPGARLGDSVAVDGCCLTVAGIDGSVLEFTAVAETLRRTTLGGLTAGDRVNLEPALRVGDPMGGHWVQGHVDGVGEVVRIDEEGEALNVTFAAPAEIMRYAIEKGSVCVAGVGLTITALDETSFSVSLVPHTLAVTTLGALGPGDRVNLEADVLAKYVEKLAFPGALVRSDATA